VAISLRENMKHELKRLLISCASIRVNAQPNKRRFSPAPASPDEAGAVRPVMQHQVHFTRNIIKLISVFSRSLGPMLIPRLPSRSLQVPSFRGNLHDHEAMGSMRIREWGPAALPC
jgi:hypothetical protein